MNMKPSWKEATNAWLILGSLRRFKTWREHIDGVLATPGSPPTSTPVSQDPNLEFQSAWSLTQDAPGSRYFSIWALWIWIISITYSFDLIGPWTISLDLESWTWTLETNDFGPGYSGLTPGAWSNRWILDRPILEKSGNDSLWTFYHRLESFQSNTNHRLDLLSTLRQSCRHLVHTLLVGSSIANELVLASLGRVSYVKGVKLDLGWRPSDGFGSRSSSRRSQVNLILINHLLPWFHQSYLNTNYTHSSLKV